MTEDLHPDGRAEDHQNYRCQQAEPAAYHRPTGGQFGPVHGEQNDWEVTACRNREGQSHHKGDVLLLKQDPQQNSDHAQYQHGDFGNLQLVALARAFTEDVGVEVVRYRRRARQRQPGDHRKDGGEGHGGDKAEEQVAAHRVGGAPPPCCYRQSARPPRL